MFSNRAQCMYREERQSGNNEDNYKCHYSESQCIRLQRTGTFRYEFLLRQQPGNGNLSDNRKEATQNQNDTTCPVPEISIITQAFETGTVIGGTGSVLVKLFTQTVES